MNYRKFNFGRIFWVLLGLSILSSFDKTILFLAIFLLIIFLFKKFNNNNNNNMNKYNFNNFDFSNVASFLKKGTSFLVLLVVLIIILPLIIVVVDAGETGVYSLFGKVKEAELKSGLHIKNPFAKITKMTIRTEEYTMTGVSDEGKVKGTDSIQALTKEGLDVALDITVLYRLNEEKASDVYREVGLTYEDKIIRPVIRSSIRETIALYDAKVIYSEKRTEIAEKISTALNELLDKRGIVLEEFLLRNVELPMNLQNSIEEKLQAEQEAEKMDFVLTKETKEKERKIIEAEGQKESQEIINQSLTANYLNYLYIKNLENREGTIYVPIGDNGMPLFKNIP
jgi:regulator of protease activity HflC (stomatin/prohibitin superfamily)